jgi:hypothetical protein
VEEGKSRLAPAKTSKSDRHGESPSQPILLCLASGMESIPSAGFHGREFVELRDGSSLFCGDDDVPAGYP